MRLIDADKYCDFLNTYPLEKAQNNFMSFYQDALQHTFECEVEAIPIEWIKMFMQRYKIQGGDEYKLLHFMITEWEKWENQYGKD